MIIEEENENRKLKNQISEKSKWKISKSKKLKCKRQNTSSGWRENVQKPRAPDCTRLHEDGYRRALTNQKLLLCPGYVPVAKERHASPCNEPSMPSSIQKESTRLGVVSICKKGRKPNPRHARCTGRAGTSCGVGVEKEFSLQRHPGWPSRYPSICP